MVLDGFGWFCWWFWVVLGGFGWFRVLVTDQGCYGDIEKKNGLIAANSNGKKKTEYTWTLLIDWSPNEFFIWYRKHKDTT